MEWLCEKKPALPVDAVVFDFDGTISTLRCGWEEVMEPLMTELLGEESIALIREYIDDSTGLQTIFQMKWLAERMNLLQPAVEHDPWLYKAEYNRRLMISVRQRLQLALESEAKRTDYMIKGSRELLEMLADRGVSIYIASGTDDNDVNNEVAALGLTEFFTEIKGAPEGRVNCSKEAIIRELIEHKGITGNVLAVVGDGKVEIAIGRENGARTLGVASDERVLSGVNPVKRARLLRAGADAIVGDFLNKSELAEFFFGETDI